MVWLQLIPDNKSRVITAKYLPEKKILNGREYSHSVSVWYTDIIERIEYDSDGVAVFVDKYIDVIFTPQGEVIIRNFLKIGSDLV
jgi:predicted RNA-binding protein associated with RNAse of E/G family